MPTAPRSDQKIADDLAWYTQELRERLQSALYQTWEIEYAVERSYGFATPPSKFLEATQKAHTAGELLKQALALFS